MFSLQSYANETFIMRDIGDAQRISNSLNKPMLLIFGTDDCRFCNLLKDDILSFNLSPAIDKYIICYIDVNNNEDLKKKYDISVIPDSRIIFQDKTKSRIKGYSKNKYNEWLNQ